MPVDFALAPVAGFLRGSHFPDQRRLGGNPSVQTLLVQPVQFDLAHVRPHRVEVGQLGCIVNNAGAEAHWRMYKGLRNARRGA